MVSERMAAHAPRDWGREKRTDTYMLTKHTHVCQVGAVHVLLGKT